MVHLHYYQSPIQISSRDSIVHGRCFIIWYASPLIWGAQNARQYVSLGLGSVLEHYPRLWDPQKKILEAWPSWLIGNRAWIYLAAYISKEKPSVCVFNLNTLISGTYHIELVHMLTIGWNEKLIKSYELRMTLFRYKNIKTHMRIYM